MIGFVQHQILAALPLIVLFSLYSMLFRDDHSFQLRRFILLKIIIFSQIIPFFIGVFVSNSDSPVVLVQLPEIIISAEALPQKQFNYIMNLYYAIASAMSFLLVFKVISILNNKNVILRNLNTKIFRSNDNYSFFNRIYLEEKHKNNTFIIEHENVHVQQYHSIDILLVEIVKILQFFNPAVYFLSKELRLVHELIADEEVSRKFDKIDYMKHLGNFSLQSLSFKPVNYFASQIKRRIEMLSSNSYKRNPIKVIALIPVFAILFMLYSCSEDKTQESTPNAIDYQSKEMDTQKEFHEADPETIKQISQIAMQYIGNNLKYPEEARKNNIEGKVLAEIIIDPLGEIVSVDIVDEPGYGMGDEVVRVIKEKGKFVVEEGLKTKSNIKFMLPVTFRLK